ncbi:MAG: MFS transporter [Pseudomonadota bacterium]
MLSEQDQMARRNAVVLAMAQAMGGALMSITVSLGGLVGVYLLAAQSEIATMPVTTMVLGTACGTIPAAYILEKIGRRFGFMLGAVVAAVGGLVAFTAIMHGHFVAFCAGTFIGGVAGAFVQQYRFAAAEGASEAFRPIAISTVLAGGIFAGIIGPQTVIWTKDLFLPTAYAGAYLAQTGLCIITLGILIFFKPAALPPKPIDAPPGRPLHVILRQPKVALAVLCSVVSYSIMTLVMTAAPLAMIACGFTATDAALGIQWHVIAMFAPSFFTGRLIKRFGAEPVTAVGLVLLGLCGTTALMGIAIGHFYVALILLGLGWNFGFIGGTTMLTNAQRPEERARTQAANDFIMFGVVAVSSLSSGFLFVTVGWDSINWAIFAIILVPLVLLALTATRERPATA